jgi:DNA-binding SARP family transcriptional activator/tetratricopeptide (TPR) repeat protein
MVLRLTLLGDFDARLAAGDSLSLPTRKAQALLAYLGLRPGQPHRRDKLAALLWGERTDEHARDGLRHALVALRKALSGVNRQSLLVEGQTLALNPAVVEVDVATFERRVAEGTAEALEHAVELYQGDLLLGFTVNEPLFEEWLVAERERLREVELEALARLLAHQTKSGGMEPAIRTAVRLLGLDPLQEAVHRTLMRLYARQGRRGAALRQYQVCVSVLQRELGAGPEPETRRLYQDILQQHVSGSAEPEARLTRMTPPTRPAGPGGERPLIGREGELVQLRCALDEVGSGLGRVVVIVGEAGVGKSSLVTVIGADARERGARMLLGRCYETQQILPFGPWVDALRGGGVSQEAETLQGLSPVWRAELSRLLPEVSAPDLPVPSDDLLRLFESVAQLVEQLTIHGSLVLVLEDLHWADEMSLRLFAFVSRRTRTARALIAATAREEELASAPILQRVLDEVGTEPHFVRMPLAPLSRGDTAALVRSLARRGSDEALVARLSERLWAASEGNPFMIVETMRALDEGAVTETAPSLLLPARVRQVIAGRLERLSQRGQQLAAMAAVIGREFEFPVLQTAAGLGARDVAEGVEELVRRRVFHGIGEHLDFTHERVREVVRDRLLAHHRKFLHGQVARAIEEVYAQNLEPHFEALGMHYRQGEVWKKAARYLQQAGLKAATRSAPQDARAWFEQALAVLEALPESQSTLEEAFELRLELRTVLMQVGEVRRMLERLREAETVAERLNDDRRRGQVCAFVSNVHSLLGELDEAVVTGTCALEIAGRLGDLRLRIITTSYLEQTHYLRGEYERVAGLAIDNLGALPADWVYEYFGLGAPASVWDRSWLVMTLAQLGRFTQAAEHEVEAIRLAEPTHHAFTVVVAYRPAGTLYPLKGDWAKARARIEHAMGVARAANIMVVSAGEVASSAWVLAQLGEASEALNRIREAEQLLERQTLSGFVGRRGWSYHALGCAYLLLGRLDEARCLADRAVESSPRQPGFAAHALHLLGDIATHPERFDAERGEAHYRQALTLAEPRGMRPLIAHCHLGLGKLYGHTGKRQEAQEHLTTATTMYREMGMTYWLEKADAEMRELA